MVSFESVGSFLKENSKKAADAAVAAANVAKLTADIKAEELKMYDIYKEIGKLYADKAQGEVDEEFVPLLQKIADAKAKIAKLSEEKENIKNPAAQAPAEAEENTVVKEADEVPANEEAEAVVSEESEAAAEEEAAEAPAEENPADDGDDGIFAE